MGVKKFEEYGYDEEKLKQGVKQFKSGKINKHDLSWIIYSARENDDEVSEKEKEAMIKKYSEVD
ncbi:hypothetical protein C9439_03720 [archaeon SCG-AAA382B04]|nr:hypothetical protein C9439_03720 [archaeon SCG-AAA382B04]